jgi:diaminopimelate epimerase
MHGIGNDMIVLDSRASGFVPSAAQAMALCDRRRGIGADQLLALLPSTVADFKMRILNADGSEVEMCGNGIRCLARFIVDRGLSAKNPLAIETLAGIIRPEVRGEQVRVDMGEPVFDPERIPVKVTAPGREAVLEVDGELFHFRAVSMGNPHCVIQVDDVEAVPLEAIGPKIERHPWFPRRANVEFVEVTDRERLRVRVWERGAGVTLACGTGACAAAVAMIDLGRAERLVTVSLPGGDLTIEWNAATNHVWMTGPASTVFTGTIEL